MGLYINGEAKKSPDLPLALGDADTACNVAGNGNSITWVYY